jgi:hypothetical protein
MSLPGHVIRDFPDESRTGIFGIFRLAASQMRDAWIASGDVGQW